MRRLRLHWLAMLAGFAVSASAGATGFACPTPGLAGSSLFTTLCYSCFFPIAISGSAGGPNFPSGAAAGMCTCPGRLFGYPTTGPTYGMWYPDKIFETVRMPYCSPTLGTRIGGGSGGGTNSMNVMLGGPNTQDTQSDQAPYYHFHLFKYPIAQILDQMQETICVSQTGSSDANLMYISEIDPTWDNTPLSMMTTPEAVLFANPIALAACIADGIAATVYQPIETLFWCAGSWGSLYPFTGFNGYGGSPQRVAAVTNTRALAAMHRRLLAPQTKGQMVVCRESPNPIYVKNQYKWQQIYPVPETLTNHWTGESVWKWGEFRHIPAVGEDFVNINWRWSDCCANP